jgi:hypothetical protein
MQSHRILLPRGFDIPSSNSQFSCIELYDRDGDRFFETLSTSLSTSDSEGTLSIQHLEKEQSV